MNFLFLLVSVLTFSLSLTLDPPYGQLKVVGTHLTNASGAPVQLRGMSLFMSAVDPGPKWYNAVTVKGIRDYWNSNIVRACMWITGYGNIGYIVNPEIEYERVKTVVDAAIEYGIYVLVDWHISGDTTNYTQQAVQFFTNISQTYGSYPHIIYEIWNEPTVAWSVVKTYANQVIPAIRANDPNNVIVVGTPVWDQALDQAADDPLNYNNLAYTMHYYADTYKQQNRDTAVYAINKGLPIFVTEYGAGASSGDGHVNVDEEILWWNFVDEYKISIVNWDMGDKAEADSALIPNTDPSQIGDPSRWSTSGKLINQKYWSTDQGVNPGNYTKATNSSIVQCPSGWYHAVANTNKCYKFVANAQTLAGAQVQCKNLNSGSTLLSIDHSFENLEINEEAAIEIKTFNKLYIGLVRSNGIWSWLNGDNQTYRNWNGDFCGNSITSDISPQESPNKTDRELNTRSLSNFGATVELTMVMSLIYEFTVSGVDHSYAGNGGLECSNYIPMWQMIFETIIIVPLCFYGIGWSIGKLEFPKEIPIKDVELKIPCEQNSDKANSKISSLSICPQTPETVKTARYYVFLAYLFVYLAQIGYKLTSKTAIYLLNPCHMSTVFQLILLQAKEDSPWTTQLFRFYLYIMPGAILAILFPILNCLLLPGEVLVYYGQHFFIIFVPMFLMYCGGPYVPESYNNIAWPIFSGCIFILYHYILLQPLGLLTLVNLDSILCPAISDPFASRYWRLSGCMIILFVMSSMTKFYNLIGLWLVAGVKEKVVENGMKKLS